MSKHTAGPWKILRRFDIHQDRGKIGGIFIGSTRGGYDLPESIKLIDEANARLIAAAPDLLAACKEALYQLQGMDSACVMILKDAIKKAEGEV